MELLLKILDGANIFGLKFWYNPDAEPGNRITSVRLLDGSKLDPNKYYKLATNDFMAAWWRWI